VSVLPVHELLDVRVAHAILAQDRLFVFCLFGEEKRRKEEKRREQIKKNELARVSFSGFFFLSFFSSLLSLSLSN